MYTRFFAVHAPASPPAGPAAVAPAAVPPAPPAPTAGLSSSELITTKMPTMSTSSRVSATTALIRATSSPLAMRPFWLAFLQSPFLE